MTPDDADDHPTAFRKLYSHFSGRVVDLSRRGITRIFRRFLALVDLFDEDSEELT